jgi:hypothetical protein
MLGKIARSPAKPARKEPFGIVNRLSFKGVWRDPCPLAIFTSRSDTPSLGGSKGKSEKFLPGATEWRNFLGDAGGYF